GPAGARRSRARPRPRPPVRVPPAVPRAELRDAPAAVRRPGWEPAVSADDDARADLGRRLLLATRGAGEELEPLVHDGAEEVLRAPVANPALEEDSLLVLLRRPDLSPELLRQVASDAARTKSYRVRLALVRHVRTPASSTLKFVPQLHLFDLVAVS